MNLLGYTKKAYLSRILILAFDMFLVVISISLATIFRINFDYSQFFQHILVCLIFTLIIRLLSFRWFRTYAVIIRYAGLSDLLNVFYAITGGSIFLIGLSVILRPYGLQLPISILMIDYFLMLALMAASRVMMPSLHNLFVGQSRHQSNVVIIGAGQLGAMTRNVLKQDQSTYYNIIAILDDDKDLQNKSLDGIPIYFPEQLKSLINENSIEKAIFAITEISSIRKNKIVDLCLNEGLKVLQVPYKSSWINEDFQAQDLKEIQIEDLLDRPEIVLDEKNIFNSYQNKKILITGAAGSIGSEIVRQLIKYRPAKLFLLDQAESPLVDIDLECKEENFYEDVLPIIADVSDKARLKQVFEEYAPDVVFHAAAYKHVPIMESYPREAINVNILGTKILADLSDQYGVIKFVMVSTDKAVNPTNVMGASKRIAEIYIQSLDNMSSTQFITTRFGNVLGSNGSVVPRFKKQIAKGGPVTVTHRDITRYFMTIPEASQLVLEAGAMGNGGEIFLFDMGDPVKISDLATKMIRLSGLQPETDIEIKYTGLRPGEKLYEELLSNEENSIPTHHPKITKANVRRYPLNIVSLDIDNLIESLEEENDMSLVSRMKKIVPEFESKNSIFNILDVENPDSQEVWNVKEN